MLTLPLVCKAFGRACDTTSVLTLRLGSRLCLVADMLEAAPTGPLDDWSLAMRGERCSRRGLSPYAV